MDPRRCAVATGSGSAKLICATGGSGSRREARDAPDVERVSVGGRVEHHAASPTAACTTARRGRARRRCRIRVSWRSPLLLLCRCSHLRCGTRSRRPTRRRAHRGPEPGFGLQGNGRRQRAIRAQPLLLARARLCFQTLLSACVFRICFRTCYCCPASGGVARHGVTTTCATEPRTTECADGEPTPNARPRRYRLMAMFHRRMGARILVGWFGRW